MKELSGWIWALLFWGYITVKVVGTSFAAWSWWWLLVPIVPWLSLGVKAYGL